MKMRKIDPEVKLVAVLEALRGEGAKAFMQVALGLPDQEVRGPGGGRRPRRRFPGLAGPMLTKAPLPPAVD